MTRFAWLKAMPVAPKTDHVGELLDRLRLVRSIGLPPETAERVHEERLRQLVREGQASDAYQLGRYAAHRRRAILVATVLDLEARLTDAVLDMADKLIWLAPPDRPGRGVGDTRQRAPCPSAGYNFMVDKRSGKVEYAVLSFGRRRATRAPRRRVASSGKGRTGGRTASRSM